MIKEITHAQATKAGRALARIMPRPPSPLLLAVKKFVQRSLYLRSYTTHYQQGGMRCKLYGFRIARLPDGLEAFLKASGFRNVSIHHQADDYYGYPSVTILASLVGEYVSPTSPVVRAPLAKRSQKASKPKRKACPCCGRNYK